MAAAVAVAAGCVCLGLVCGNERTPPLASRRRCCVGGQPPFHRGSRPSASLTAAGGLPPYKAGAVCVCVIGWGVSRWSWGWRCVEEWWVSVVCVAALLVGDFVAHPSVIDGGGGNVPHTLLRWTMLIDLTDPLRQFRAASGRAIDGTAIGGRAGGVAEESLADALIASLPQLHPTPHAHPI